MSVSSASPSPSWGPNFSTCKMDRTLRTLYHLKLWNSSKTWYTQSQFKRGRLSPISQSKGLRLREVKLLASRHTASRQGQPHVKPGQPGSCPTWHFLDPRPRASLPPRGERRACGIPKRLHALGEKLRRTHRTSRSGCTCSLALYVPQWLISPALLPPPGQDTLRIK